MTEHIEVGRVLVTLLGVPFTITSQSWKFVPPKIVIGIMIALVFLPDEPLAVRLGWGIVYGFILVSVLILHILSHILSSKLVSPPMTEAHITPILIQTLYQSDPPLVSPRIHLVRSLGGPLINLLIGIMALVAGVLGTAMSWCSGEARMCVLLCLFCFRCQPSMAKSFGAR